MALFATYRHVTDCNREYIITDANSCDNIVKGTPLDTKAEEMTRIWCTNINGITYDDMGGKLTNIIAIAKETSSDIISITKHNTDTTK